MIANQSNEVKVTLLPEEDGKVGVISLKDDKGVEHTIDKPYKSLGISDDGAIRDIEVSEKEISLKYGKLLEAMPEKLKNFYFFFDTGSAKLSEAQIQEIKEVAKFISTSNIHRIISIGHSDSRGSDAVNERVSKQRAKAVADELIANGVNAELIALKYYGDANPLVKTKANESNSQNRRVEIVLK
jgi:OOP family OmpA-OmpF porin